MHSAIMFYQLPAYPLTQSNQHIKLTITGFYTLLLKITSYRFNKEHVCVVLFSIVSILFTGLFLFNTSLSLQYRALDLQFSELDIIIIWIEKTIDNLYVNDLT